MEVTPTDALRKNIRTLRDMNGWSARRLAEGVQAHGSGIDRAILANIECGRRESVSIEELMAFAYVLDTSPNLLIAHGPTVQVATLDPVPASDALKWMRGKRPLQGQDPSRFKYHADVLRELRERGRDVD